MDAELLLDTPAGAITILVFNLIVWIGAGIYFREMWRRLKNDKR